MRMTRRPGMAVSLLVLFSGLLVWSLCLAPRAEAYIYWTVGTQSTTLGRADLDGSGKPQFIPAPIGTHGLDNESLAVNDTHIYYGGNLGRFIGRVNLNGSGDEPDFILSRDWVEHVAVNDTHVYWTNGLGFNNAIGRARLDGSGIDSSFITMQDMAPGGSFSCPSATNPLAVDAAHVYWPETVARGLEGQLLDPKLPIPGMPFPEISSIDETIARANVDGSGIDRDFIDIGRWQPRSTDPGAGTYVRNIAVDANHIYWTSGYMIGRANLDGSGVDRRLVTLPEVLSPDDDEKVARSLAVAGDHIYWSTSVRQEPRFLTARANLDGSGVDHSFINLPAAEAGFGGINGFSCGFGLAVDLLDGHSSFDTRPDACQKAKQKVKKRKRLLQLADTRAEKKKAKKKLKKAKRKKRKACG